MEKWMADRVSSSGYAMAPVFVVSERKTVPDLRHISDSETSAEIARFEAAVVQVQDEFSALSKHHILFEAYSLLAGDPDLLRKVTDRIHREHLTAEAALVQVRNEYIRFFQAMENEYMRDRTADLKDVMRKILFALKGIDDTPFAALKERSIILSTELFPSDIIKMDPALAAGYVMEEGGITSHVSIMARKHGTPCLTGVGSLLSKAKDGMPAILDAEKGILYLEPDEELIDLYQKKGCQRETGFSLRNKI